MSPKYTLDKIKFGLDEGTWKRAVALYEKGAVTDFEDTGSTFTAKVQGTHWYEVVVSPQKYTDGNCTCYLGQNDTLCKHMIAVAIHAVKNGNRLTEEEKTQHNELKCSGQKGALTDNQMDRVGAEITGAIRYIKPYDGPSRTWFAYQDSLTEGCNRLAAILSQLPVSLPTANLIVKTLIRLDRKLTQGGVDDSDGTVGNFIEEGVELLKQFASLDNLCRKAFDQLKGIDSCFGWEEDLVGKDNIRPGEIP